MCNTYQEAVERDCPCRYTLRMVANDMIAGSAPYRKVAGFLIKVTAILLSPAVFVVGAIILGVLWCIVQLGEVIAWAIKALWLAMTAPRKVPVVTVAPKVKPVQSVYGWDLSSLSVNREKHDAR